jgi:hypothetical protein
MRGIVPEKKRSHPWQFWAIFAADDPLAEPDAGAGVSYSKAAWEVKMEALESTFPLHRCAETFP